MDDASHAATAIGPASTRRRLFPAQLRARAKPAIYPAGRACRHLFAAQLHSPASLRGPATPLFRTGAGADVSLSASLFTSAVIPAFFRWIGRFARGILSPGVFIVFLIRFFILEGKIIPETACAGVA